MSYINAYSINIYKHINTTDILLPILVQTLNTSLLKLFTFLGVLGITSVGMTQDITPGGECDTIAPKRPNLIANTVAAPSILFCVCFGNGVLLGRISTAWT